MLDSVAIIDFYVLEDRGQVIAHLADFNWDFERHGPVRLLAGGRKLPFRYVGSGNQQDVAFVVLEPAEGISLREVAALSANDSQNLRLVRVD